MFKNFYLSLVVDEDERALGFKLLAEKIYKSYMSQIPQERKEAIGLDPIDDMQRRALNELLDGLHRLAGEPDDAFDDERPLVQCLPALRRLEALERCSSHPHSVS